MKKIYVYLIMYIIIALICPFNSLSWVQTAYEWGYHASIWDGVFVYSVSGFVMSNIVPLILVYGIMYNQRYNFTPVCITHIKDRLKLWHRQMITILVISFMAIITVMMFSAITVYIKTNNIEFVSYYSIIRGEFLILGEDIPVINIPKMFIVSVCINTIDLFIKLIISELMYWLTNSQIAAVVIVIIMGVIPNRMTKYSQIYHYKVEGGMYYSELCLTQRIVEDILIFMIAIIMLEVIARIFVPKKNFYK